MAQKKRGSSPIRITLTEDQISDIIQSAAKTRRGLRVENLEERIAPSVIGGPMFDGGPGPDAPPPLPGLDSNPDVPSDPLPGLDSNPDVPSDPLPGLDSNPDADPLLGLDSNPDTLVPPPVDGDTENPGAPPPPPAPELPGSPAPADATSGGGSSGGSSALGDGVNHPLNTGLPSHDSAPLPQVPMNGETGAPQMPSSDEMEEHRRNILRNLRGN